MKTLQELTNYKNENHLRDLQTLKLGRNYFYYNEIDSTQKEIWRRIEKNQIVDGTLIRAEKQTAGIGTHGRKWVSTTNNIAFSFYAELNCKLEKLEGITVEIAEIIINLIKEMYGIQLDIKLPNDIYFGGKKLGGILTETKVKGNLAKCMVVGIGINNSQINFVGELNNIASSVKKEFGIEIEVEKFISYLCNRFEKIITNRIED